MKNFFKFKTALKSKRKNLKYRGTECLNCGHPLDLSDRYCPKCSQINSTKRVSFWDLLMEFFDTIFSYDSKFRKTIGVIMRHPGKITREYIDGKQKTYTNPFRFFLSLLFFYIILLNITFDLSMIDELVNKTISEQEIATQLASDESKEKIDSIAAIATKELKKEKVDLGPISFELNPDSLSTRAQTKLEEKQRKETKKAIDDSLHYLSAKKYFDSINLQTPNRFTRINSKSDIFLYGIKKHNILSYSHLIEEMKVDDNWENLISYRLGFNQYRLKKTPSLFINFFINKSPFVIFFVIPFLALFIWLIYSKKKFYYMDHLVFCYHTLTMLILTALIIIITYLITNSDVIEGILIFVGFIYNHVYLYKAMRKFYGQGRLKTFAKYLYINLIFNILATISMLTFAFASFILY